MGKHSSKKDCIQMYKIICVIIHTIIYNKGLKMSIAYKRDEMVGITELSRSLGKYLDKVISNPLNKLAIVRSNKPEAVIVPIEEYEQMKAASDYLEDIGIAEMLKERVFNRKEPAKYITMDELIIELRKDGRNV